jgi:hypothetical protein
MQCLYCGATLGLLSRGEFCNKKHREQWHEQQAQLSIQRLVEAFGYDKTAAEKPEPEPVVVVDWASRDAVPVPPVALFAHRDSHEEIKSPVTPAIQHAPPKRGSFYRGSDSGGQAPPDAGFISTIDVNKGLHLPVFNRRPALSEKGLNVGFDSNLINTVVRTIDPRYERRRFIRVLSVSSTEARQARLSGRSAPRPSLDLSGRQNLCQALPVQRKSLRALTCVPGQPVQACALPPEASRLTLFSGPQSYAVPRMALLQRETLSTPVTVPSITIVSKLARGALRTASEPLHSPAHSGFQALPAGQILRGQFTQLQFQACKVAHPPLQACEPEPRLWQASVPTAAVGSYEVPPAHLHTREVESRSTTGTQRPKIGQASLPQSAARLPVGYTQAPQAFALTVRRSDPAPRNCGFYALAPQPMVSTRATALGASGTGVAQQPVAQQLQPRQFGFACGRVPVTPVEGCARIREQPPALQSAGKRSSAVSLTALDRREMPEQTAPFISYYPKIRPASLPRPEASRPGTGRLRPRGVAISIGRLSSRLFDCADRALAINQSIPVQAEPITLPRIASEVPIASPRPKVRGTVLPVQSRHREFQVVPFSVAAIQVLPVKAENKVCRASELIYEVRPMELLRRTADREPVPAWSLKIPLTRLSGPSNGRSRVTPATRTSQAAPVSLAQLSLALPNCTFQAVRTRPGTPAQAKTTTQVSASPPPSLSSLPSLEAGTAQVQRRELDFRPSQVFTTTRTTPLVASRPEKQTKEYAASSQVRQPRPIALRGPTATRQPVFAWRMTSNPVLARPTTPPPPSAVQIRARKAFGITSGRPAPLLPNCSFHALATRFGASPMDSQIRINELGSGQTVAIRFYARDLRLRSPASMLFDSPVFLGAELSSQRSKFVAQGFDFDYNIGVPSRRLPSWDPEQTPCFQFAANPNGATVALVGSSRMARTATWALPEARLQLQLRASEIAAVAYRSTGTKPAGAKGDLKWVAHKIPWAPMP